MNSKCSTGSSPRVRGEAAATRSQALPPGIIPAGAGRSVQTSSPGRSVGDHPRGCGEKQGWSHFCTSSWGSSPRVRGEDSHGSARLGATGIIPAGAGRSHSRRSTTTRSRDHPRGCGEKVADASSSLSPPGSSPRVRGEVGVVGEGLDAFGIIPAGAGRSLGLRRCLGRQRDHPRGCGEKRGDLTALPIAGGSSPRVRGEGEFRLVRVLREGIIPAGAGRRVCQLKLKDKDGDHPRGCGEKT